jgi:hypothetical protein
MRFRSRDRELILRCHVESSCAGLTRASIEKILSKRMDCRVKPGNDEIAASEFAARRRTVFDNSSLTMSNSPDLPVPATRFPRPGFATLASLTPNRGVGGAPRNVRALGGTPVGRIMTRYARRLARRLASHMTWDARLSALHRGGFGLRARASLTGICAGSDTASSSHPGRSAWRAGSRASRGERLRAAAAGRHASLRIQDRL